MTRCLCSRPGLCSRSGLCRRACRSCSRLGLAVVLPLAGVLGSRGGRRRRRRSGRRARTLGCGRRVGGTARRAHQNPTHSRCDHRGRQFHGVFSPQCCHGIYVGSGLPFHKKIGPLPQVPSPARIGMSARLLVQQSMMPTPVPPNRTPFCLPTPPELVPRGTGRLDQSGLVMARRTDAPGARSSNTTPGPSLRTPRRFQREGRSIGRGAKPISR